MGLEVFLALLVVISYVTLCYVISNIVVFEVIKQLFYMALQFASFL